MAAQRARYRPPVGPILAAVDGVKLRLTHGPIGRRDGVLIGLPKTNAALGEAPFGAPLPPAYRQEIAGGLRAPVTLADMQHSHRRACHYYGNGHPCGPPPPARQKCLQFPREVISPFLGPLNRRRHEPSRFS